MESVRISFLNSDEVIDDSDIYFLEQFLSQERLERNLKFRKEEDRKRSILAESLVLFCLMKDYGISPDRICFGRDVYGKPFLRSHRTIHFNLSHSGNWVACILGTGPVGIDIEQCRQDIDPISTGQIFSAREKEILQALNTEDRLERFYQLWTLKESYTKALGAGIGRGFETFKFEWDELDAIDLYDPLDQGNSDFQFQSFSLDKEHISAACFPSGRSVPDVSFILLSELLKDMKRIESRD
ncbi:4'-phosphopantetheinyl transferase superfamily protein [Oceanispirochaeta sp.]|jgi:4'-phosphopantetheinyl transferase|uniref:4'-phosphopantetheinyl transferase family protein n=1 Tax=Oceanispirochaeta sp. TaxID=2035350 RepID=UPI0026051FE6|nr:4'-phosphopantetheinyl transferase superfamily protein [Oceanispirochaeta sp.]MDA3957569.1 4'-phosphopantetheinyl transferase superfamily protein [Oceanispirochaeta sp.]